MNILLATDGSKSADAAQRFLAAAREVGADLVVVGSEGLSGIEGLLLGSVARNVAHHASCPVLVVRRPGEELRRIVVAVDASEHAARAVEFVAERFPLPDSAEVTVIHVLRPLRRPPGLPRRDPAAAGEPEQERTDRQAAGEERLERARAVLEAAGKRVTTLIAEGDPAQEIEAAAAAQDAGLIVAGARGVSPIERLLVGSVADRLLRTAGRPVLIVP